MTLENGLQRRPKRAKSANHFLNYVLTKIQKTINNKDTSGFNKEFKAMTISCNNCPVIEKITFFLYQTQVQYYPNIHPHHQPLSEEEGSRWTALYLCLVLIKKPSINSSPISE